MEATQVFDPAEAAEGVVGDAGFESGMTAAAEIVAGLAPRHPATQAFVAIGLADGGRWSGSPRDL